MKIRAKSLEEIILSLICIAGEVDEDYLFNRLSSSILNPYDYTYAKRVLHRMEDEKLINKKEYREGRKKYLRLSKIKGDDAASKISDEMMPHFYLMAGDINNRYKGTGATLLRKKNQSLLTLTHMLDGITTDYFELEMGKEEELPRIFRESVFSDEGALRLPNDIISHLEPSKTNYITSNALKGINKASGIFKGNSKFSGVLISPPKIYISYFIPYAGYSWSIVEEQLKLLIGIYASSIQKDMNESPDAIMYLADSNTYSEFINHPPNEKSERGKSKQLNPREIYKAAYFLPLSENYSQIREFLLMDDGEDKLNKIALENAYVPGESYDGIVQGCKIYNLLLSDFCKIQRIKTRVKQEDSIIVIHKWQEEAMRKYFGEKTRIITVTENEFNEYLENAYEI